MIIIHLTGGLGNQLFQYAFARSLSYNLDVELFLDISLFSHTEKRKHVVFGLHSFNIKGIIGYYPYIDKTSVGINYSQDCDLISYVEGFPFPDSLHNYEVIDSFDNIKLPAYFKGWFQHQIDDCKTCYITENYFKINNNLIHNDLKYSLPLSDNSKRLLKEIKQYDSVALHIRHGDYINYPKFGFCTKQYYQNAINFITKDLSNPKFYIFTEDPEWVDSNLQIGFPYQIIRFNEKNNTAGRGYAELLRLMSSCEHFIIANSTFSWWGAFLSENKNKLIISPKPWFQDRTVLEADTIDNVKTISLKNDYSSIFDNSKRLLYNMDENNISFKNLEYVEENNSFKLLTQENDSKLFLKNIIPKSPNAKVIIRFEFKSNCLNGLRIYYKTVNEDVYSEINTLNLYYYKNEYVNHCLILPNDIDLSEIMINPYILKKNEEDSIEIKSIMIKEFFD